MTFIIEHLEPEIYKWCLIEYKNISKIVGKNNLWFTNIKKNGKNIKELKKHGKIFSKSVKDMELVSACVLDPEAKKLLTPKDKNKFRYFIFGGILGDYPPKKRTKKELTKFIKGNARNIGKKQFSTDNAVFVVNEILKGKEMKEMKFKNKIEIKINKIESIILPYYYPIIRGKPMISQAIIKYLKRKKDF